MLDERLFIGDDTSYMQYVRQEELKRHYALELAKMTTLEQIRNIHNRVKHKNQRNAKVRICKWLKSKFK